MPELIYIIADKYGYDKMTKGQNRNIYISAQGAADKVKICTSKLVCVYVQRNMNRKEEAAC